MPSDEKPGDKPRPKRARPKRAKPSFAPTPSDPAPAGWAYRSDAPAPRAALPPPSPRGAVALEHALDWLAVPIGIALMAALAPVSALLAPRRKS